MKILPILFSGPMVRAILDGKKTVTRRLRFNHIEAGDYLWVRETWRMSDNKVRVLYRADEGMPRTDFEKAMCSWKPSIFMRPEHHRIGLIVTDVRQEPLQNMHFDDALAEGFHCDKPVTAFKELWDKLNSKRGGSWDSNPIVTVIEFKRAEKLMHKGKK